MLWLESRSAGSVRQYRFISTGNQTYQLKVTKLIHRKDISASLYVDRCRFLVDCSFSERIGNTPPRVRKSPTGWPNPRDQNTRRSLQPVERSRNHRSRRRRIPRRCGHLEAKESDSACRRRPRKTHCFRRGSRRKRNMGHSWRNNRSGRL